MVAIIVLNWNGWQHTLPCLDSLLPWVERGMAHLIVCDNASSDDSWARLHAWCQHSEPQITLVQTGHNLGFAGGMNVGLRLALARGGYEFVWLLNNDTLAEANSLDALLRCAQARPQVGLWGSTVAGMDYRVQTAGGCRYNPWLTIFRNLRQGEDARTLLHEGGNAAEDGNAATDGRNVRLDYVYGAALFAPMTSFQRVGLLAEDYFLFYEELDLCRRLRRAGLELAWCPASLVLHHGSASVNGDTATPPQHSHSQRSSRLRANYYENLSTLKFTARFHPRLFPIAYVLRFTLKTLALLVTGRMYLWPALWHAYRDFARIYKSTR